jgi:acyl-CoA thioesterase-1
MRFTAVVRFLLIVAFLSTSTARADSYQVLVMGDSISAAYGLSEQDGWVHLAEQQFRERGHDVTFTNSSISGDTTGGGLRRLPDALKRFDPDLLVIELGGNDGLRGYPPKSMQQNLQGMAELAQDHGADVLILGMMIPSNYGPAYLKMFTEAFEDSATQSGTTLLPFFLEPIAQNRDYFQPDGIHPTAEAQPLLVDYVTPYLEEFIKQPDVL